MINLKLVGKIKDAQGIKGELYVLIFSGEAGWIKKLKKISICKQQDNFPEIKELTIESARKHKDGIVIKTKEIQDRTLAEQFKGWFFYIPQDLLKSEKGEIVYLSELIGFSFLDRDLLVLGKVEGFSSNGAQDLFLVRTERGLFEVPFVEAFVIKIDHTQKTILVDLPLGLLGEDID